MQQRERQAQKRSSTEFREQENLKNKEYIKKQCKGDEFKINERERDKYRKAQQCKSDDFRDDENVKK